MCGIVGYASARRAVNRAELDDARDRLQLRGPDSYGTWLSDDHRIGFGHRRLAIIDLSPGGHQPMLDAASGCVITFNGEIYNFRRLRHELEASGVKFRTESDTEVLLSAYRVWGDSFLDRIDGMFAFAIFDPRLDEVLVARDRAGEKPLFYTHERGVLSFASEIKGLVEHSGSSRTICPVGLEQYLAYGYTAGSDTIYKGVRRLAAGHVLKYSVASDALTVSRYWSLPRSSAGRSSAQVTEAAAAEYTDAFDRLLTKSIEQQLIADVPIGVLLSGGLDSSLVTAVAARVSRQPLRTFTVRMKGSTAFDESPFARLVSHHVGSDHHELTADPHDQDVLPAIMRNLDEPFADSSIIPTYLVSRAIRSHATVAIGGDGGDELFAGYRRHEILAAMDRQARRLPQPIRRGTSAIAHVLPASFPGRQRLLGFSEGLRVSIPAAGRLFSPTQRAALLRSTGVSSAPEEQVVAQSEIDSPTLHRLTSTDFRRYMVDDVLVKVDRASMMVSLEVRAPLLARSIIEFAFGELPDAMRLNGSARKVIMRRLAKRYLPPSLDVTRKQGFSIPLGQWIATRWRDLANELLNQSDSLIDLSLVRPMLRTAATNQYDADRIFAILALQLWRREHGLL